MAMPDDPEPSSLGRAIVLMEDALSILDAQGLTLAAARLSEALDCAHAAQLDQQDQ